MHERTNIRLSVRGRPDTGRRIGGIRPTGGGVHLTGMPLPDSDRVIDILDTYVTAILETNAGTKAAFTFVSERGAPFNDVIEFRSPPPAVQRALFAALTPIARSWISSWTWSTAKAGSAVSARRIA